MPFDPNANYTLSNGDKTATQVSATGHTLITIIDSFATGKKNVEFVINIITGGSSWPGIITPGGATSYPGSTAGSAGYSGQNGYKYNNAVATAYGAAYGATAVISIHYDADAGKIWWSLNGVLQGGDPAAGTGAAYDFFAGEKVFAIGTYYVGDQVSVLENATEGIYLPPDGFSWIGAESLTIVGKTFILNYGDILSKQFKINYGNIPLVSKTLRLLCGQAPLRGRSFRIKYDQARIVGQHFKIRYSSASAIGKNLVVKYLQSSGPVGKLFKIIYESTGNTPVGKLLKIIYQSAAIGFGSDQVAVSLTVGDQAIKSILSLSVGTDEGRFLWEAEAQITSQWEATLLDQFEPVILTRYGTVYQLIVIDRSKAEQVSDGYANLWTIKLASRSYILSAAAAVPVTKTWSNGSAARAIVQEMVDIAGIGLNWQIADYVMGELVADRQAPIEIIRSVLNLVGALPDTTPAGALLVRKEYPALPLIGTVPDYIITGLQINSIQQQAADPQPVYNYVVVSNATTATDTVAVNHEEEARTDGGVDIKAWAEPWAAVTVKPNAALGDVSLIPQGIMEESIADWLQFIDGVATTSKPIFKNFRVAAFRGADPGEVAWTPDSKDITADGDFYCLVEYDWRYYLFTYYSHTGLDYQTILED